MNLMSYPSVKRTQTNLWVYGRVVSSSFRLLRFRRNAQQKQEKLKVQPVQLVRKSEKVKSVVALQPKFRAKPTWSHQMSGWTSRQQGAKQKSQNQARWSSSRCNVYDPFLEPSLLFRRFEILKRTSTIGLKPKWPPYFGMVNFMIIRGRYLKFRPTGPNDLQKAVVMFLYNNSCKKTHCFMWSGVPQSLM